MSAAKHTPGPWHLGGEHGAAQLRPRISILRSVTYVEGASPTTYIIGKVGYPTTTGNTVGAAEREANARLIAAAPELLAEIVQSGGILLALRAHLANVVSAKVLADIDARSEAIEAVIAKATGSAA